ncbi:hypothetical protein HF909_10725 [Ralstonia pseudosolanacearum]|uniref:Uncharacterized protein n=1 Tax=Ralstonia solanacearum TaxID=305 RepID=A0AA92K266_RALSL|nr:hypothetical protein [Ralstonia pseudosolanacearum]QOK96858.1 hypothetical protein HF909_10725 [Ralstonia pseudosolanacearum]
MKNTPQEKTLRNPNYSTEHMQTAADFKTWYVANNAAIKAEQGRMRAMAAEKALTYLQSRVRFGASIQDAADGYFRDCMRPKYWPAVYSEVARELFRELGWVDRKGAK